MCNGTDIVCPLGGIIFCHLQTKVFAKEYYVSQPEDWIHFCLQHSVRCHVMHLKVQGKRKKNHFFFLLKVKSCQRASSTLSGAFVLFGSRLFQEKAITPDESLSLAGTDWLIGNHSDELTPWIPVMAARRVISTLNLTQLLECQLMSLKGD